MQTKYLQFKKIPEDKKAFSKKYGIYPDSPEDFQTVWKIYRQSGTFPDNLGDFQTVSMILGQS